MAFVNNIEKNGLLHEADLLPDSYGGKFHPRAVPELLSSLPVILRALQRGKVTPDEGALLHKHKALEGGQADLPRRPRQRRALRAQPLRGGRRGRRRGGSRSMKVAYWPGCVSRGFTPELHGSMAQVAPLLDIELVELDRASCCGAGVIAEHNQELADTLNARTFALAQQEIAKGADADDEHLLDLPGRAERVPGAPGREHRVPRRTSTRRSSAEGLTYEKGITNKHFLWLLVEEIGLDAIKAKVKRPLTDLRVGPFYGCYIVRPTDRLGIDDEHPRDTLPAAADRGARRHRRRLRGPVQVLRVPDHHDEQAELAQAGGPPPRRRDGRRGGLPGHAVPAVPPQPGPPAAAGRAASSAGR